MPMDVFISYAHEDDVLYEQLVKHLKPLEREGLLQAWHDRKIPAGGEFETEIRDELDRARLILLLVSPDFVSSEYCWGKEMPRAMERHEANEARVVPVILRPVDWRGSRFGKLLALPKDGKPITTWPNQDEAFFDIEQGIRAAIRQLSSPRREEVAPPPPPIPVAPPAAAVTVHLSRGKQWTDRLRKYKVLVDGAAVGEIGDNQSIQFAVSPGEHTVRLSIDWVGSNSLVLQAQAGEQIYLECGNQAGSNPLKVFSAVTVAQDSYLYVKRVAAAHN